MTSTSWTKIWRDNVCHWEMHGADFDVYNRMYGASHQLPYLTEGEDDVISIHPGCGHVSPGVDFHTFFRPCQLCAGGKLCCTTEKSLCQKGKNIRRAEPNIVAKMMKKQHVIGDYLRDKARPLQVIWLGRDGAGGLSTIERLAYAVEIGAKNLETVLDRHLAALRNVPWFAKVIQKSRACAAHDLKTHKLHSVSSIHLIPLYLCGKAGYKRQMETMHKRLESLDELWREYNPGVVAAAAAKVSTFPRTTATTLRLSRAEDAIAASRRAAGDGGVMSPPATDTAMTASVTKPRVSAVVATSATSMASSIAAMTAESASEVAPSTTGGGPTVPLAEDVTDVFEGLDTDLLPEDLLGINPTSTTPLTSTVPAHTPYQGPAPGDIGVTTPAPSPAAGSGSAVAYIPYQGPAPSGAGPGMAVSITLRGAPGLVTTEQLQQILSFGGATEPPLGGHRPLRTASAPPNPQMSTELFSPARNYYASAQTPDTPLHSEPGSYFSDASYATGGSALYQGPAAAVPQADTSIVITLPAGEESQYVQSVDDNRLSWMSDNSTATRILDGVKQRPNMELRTPGVLVLHKEVLRAVDKSEQHRRAGLQRQRANLPSTVTCQTPVENCRMHGAEEHRIPKLPPPLHSTHFAGTPNMLNPNTLMAVTYEALQFQEDLARVATHDTSVLCHAVDNLWQALYDIVEAHGSDDPIMRAIDRLDELTNASDRSVSSVVETMLAAAYHRRYAVLYGGDPAMVKRLLCNPLATATNVNGVIEYEREVEAPEKEQSQKPTVSEKDLHDRPSTSKAARTRLAAAPKKATEEPIEEFETAESDCHDVIPPTPPTTSTPAPATTTSTTATPAAKPKPTPSTSTPAAPTGDVLAAAIAAAAMRSRRGQPRSRPRRAVPHHWTSARCSQAWRTTQSSSH